MESDNNSEKNEKEECLSDDSMNSSLSTDISNINNSIHNSFSENSSPIKEVYASNFNEELKNIKSIIEEGEYTYIGMDKEFPGIIYN